MHQSWFSPCDPVLVARAHVRRVPGDLPALREQRLSVHEEAHEPLARGQELERPRAALVELHRVRDRARLGRRSAPSARSSSTIFARACFDRLALELRPGGARARRVLARERRSPNVDAAACGRRADQLAQRQALRAPELDVGLVAERADHQDARALLGIGVRRWRRIGTGARNSGVTARLAEERAVARVVGMRDHGHARAEQLRARGRDHELAAARHGEAQVVDRRRAARGPRSRPARPRSGRPRPTSWARTSSTPRPCATRSRNESCAMRRG